MLTVFLLQLKALPGDCTRGTLALGSKLQGLFYVTPLFFPQCRKGFLFFKYISELEYLHVEMSYLYTILHYFKICISSI